MDKSLFDCCAWCMLIHGWVRVSHCIWFSSMHRNPPFIYCCIEHMLAYDRVGFGCYIIEFCACRAPLARLLFPPLPRYSLSWKVAIDILLCSKIYYFLDIHLERFIYASIYSPSKDLENVERVTFGSQSRLCLNYVLVCVVVTFNSINYSKTWSAWLKVVYL